jgi:hypothetical protein
MLRLSISRPLFPKKADAATSPGTPPWASSRLSAVPLLKPLVKLFIRTGRAAARRFKCAVAVPRPAERGLGLVQCISHATIRPVARRPVFRSASIATAPGRCCVCGKCGRPCGPRWTNRSNRITVASAPVGPVRPVGPVAPVRREAVPGQPVQQVADRLQGCAPVFGRPSFSASRLEAEKLTFYRHKTAFCATFLTNAPERDNS